MVIQAIKRAYADGTILVRKVDLELIGKSLEELRAEELISFNDEHGFPVRVLFNYIDKDDE